jgi:hypothetical protein
MITKYIKLPTWKAYLYDLRERLRILRRINLRKWVPGFHIKPGDVLIIKHCLKNFGKGGVLSKQRAFIYNEFVKTVEQNQSRVNVKEFELAVRISRIKKLKLETIMGELKELKKYAEEVGLEKSDIKGLDEDDIIRMIVNNVNPKKQKYSPEFVAWYDELDEEYFEKDDDDKKGKDKKKKKEKDEDDDEFDIDDVKDIIENADKVKELKQVIEAYPDVFSQKLLKIKDMEELQEKMTEVLEEYEEEKGKSKKKEKDKKKGKEDDELNEKDKKKLIKKINDADEASELKALIKEYEVFEDIETRGKASVETLQKKMLAALGIEPEEDDDEDEKPKKKASKSSDLEEELEDMSFIELKKYAKKNGVSVPPGTTKKDTISMIIEGLEGGKKKKSKKDEDDDELEINPSIVKAFVKEKDLDALQTAAEQMGIKLSSLEKRSCKAIGEKLIEALSEKPKKEKKKESVWVKVKEMIEEGDKPKKIKKAIAEMLVEMGIDEDEAEDKAEVLIEVAQAEE